MKRTPVKMKLTLAEWDGAEEVSGDRVRDALVDRDEFERRAIADTLARLGACSEARAWAATAGTPRQAWATCQRGVWLLWLLRSLRIPVPTDAICDIAAEATQCAGPDEVLACVWAIDARRRLAHGEGSQEEVDAAWDAAENAAWAARDAVTWDTGTAGAAARAAGAAARAAAMPAAMAAAWAAGAAGVAAGATQADIIRAYVPWAVVARALREAR
jgi:hypothetical protein